ncbi:MAG: hypothetical protein QNJ51_13225 [Calothrix sp. MO_167.B12]|nr:hypothetical protein [Calothrix sp. MO_167.B12]
MQKYLEEFSIQNYLLLRDVIYRIRDFEKFALAHRVAVATQLSAVIASKDSGLSFPSVTISDRSKCSSSPLKAIE